MDPQRVDFVVHFSKTNKKYWSLHCAESGLHRGGYVAATDHGSSLPQRLSRCPHAARLLSWRCRNQRYRPYHAHQKIQTYWWVCLCVGCLVCLSSLFLWCSSQHCRRCTVMHTPKSKSSGECVCVSGVLSACPVCVARLLFLWCWHQRYRRCTVMHTQKSSSSGECVCV